jgi:DNA-binding transcriptional ArsR family regulator
LTDASVSANLLFVETYRGVRQLDALGDASRRAIVDLLADGPTSVGSLADRLPISRPAVSQHLRVLKDAGLVRDHAEGTRRLYFLDPSGPAEIRAYLDRYWGDHLAAFAEAMTEQAMRDAAGRRRGGERQDES